MRGIIGKKVGMTQVFDAQGAAKPVTVIDASSCAVVGHRTVERDGYSAVILGFRDAKERHLTRAQQGNFKALGGPAKRVVREFRVPPEALADFVVGADAQLEKLFNPGDLVDVKGVTKGRGFTGVMKRWKFRGFGQTHGTHEYRRHPGAIGQRKTPGRVFPNKKLPGHYGVEAVTVQNLEVVEVLAEQKLILLKGAIPGHREAMVMVCNSAKQESKRRNKPSHKQK